MREPQVSSGGTIINLTRGSALSLHAADQAAEDALRRFAPGEMVPVKVYKERCPGLHRKFFAMLNVAFSNQEQYLTMEAFRAAVTVEAGWYEEYLNKERGELIKYPKSIAWDKMDELEFEKFYGAAIDAILRAFIPGVDRKDLEEEIARFA